MLPLSDLETCRFSATIALILVNWVIYVNRVEAERFFFRGGMLPFFCMPCRFIIAKHNWIILIIDFSLGQLESYHFFSWPTESLAWLPAQLTLAQKKLVGKLSLEGLVLGTNYIQPGAGRTNEIARAGFIRWWTDDQQ